LRLRRGARLVPGRPSASSTSAVRLEVQCATDSKQA